MILIFCLTLLILLVVGLVIYYSNREDQSQTTRYYENTRLVYTEPEIVYDDPAVDILDAVILAEVEEEIIEDSYDFDDSDY